MHPEETENVSECGGVSAKRASPDDQQTQPLSDANASKKLKT
jgi:hypothetical protein